MQHPLASIAMALTTVLASCAPATDPVERGRYLTTAMACSHCHSPHGPDGLELPNLQLSGHPADAPLPKWDPSMLADATLATISTGRSAFAGPWGISVAPNLTPDMETGLGKLTADALVKSWKSGKHWLEDREIMPPMPSPAYGTLDDADIRAIWAYLHSLPAVKNAAPKSIPAPR